MTKRVSITSLGETAEIRGQIEYASRGGSIFYDDQGKCAAVLIPGHAFRAVQAMIKLALEMPLMCWDDPAVPLSAPTRGESPIRVQGGGPAPGGARSIESACGSREAS